MASKYIIEHIDAYGPHYHTISGQFTLNINEAHKNGCGLKNIQRDFSDEIAYGSVRIIEVKADERKRTSCGAS
ncbi:MAG: hypothetical protein B7X60_01305 [Polynucleobacter sp. 39-45-136]|jgi:hypothetical protein|nr:MAG: hypothetical protein B7X60_01305 [Polynucleobacter sp. 39-45-136]